MDKQQKHEKFNLFLKLVMAIVFMSGAIIFSYPFVVDAINNFYDQQMILKLQQANEEKILNEREKRLAEMSEKNNQLRNEKKTNIPGLGLVEDPFESIEEKYPKEEQKYYDDHTIGAIYIPRIHVSLPLFDTTNNRLLDRGATILQGTSFPIGGKDTHSVITGHSGLTNKVLFTNLEKLVVGDYFFIEIAGEKLAYEVESFKTVLPDELEDLVIEKDRDLVTLLTCTPYGVNTHRLLVKAHRIPYVEEVMAREKQATQNYHVNRFRLFMILIPLFFWLILFWMWRKFVFYQSGKYEYDFKFILLNQEIPDSGKAFQLFGKHRKPILKNGQPWIERSNEKGEVHFESLRGGKYWVVSKETEVPLKMKGSIKWLRGRNFTLSRFNQLKKQKNGKEIIYLVEGSRR